jgi:prolyl oligopeptidase
MRKLLLFALMATPLFAETPAWNYPPARKGDVVDDYFGTKVADPYRWMEDLDSPETRAWVEEENKLTFGFLKTLPERQVFQDRLTALWNYPRYGVPFKEGGKYFFSKNDGLQNQAVLFVQPSLGAAPRTLLDPNTLSKDGTVALAGTVVSPDGKWLAYGIAVAGSDWVEFRVRNVETGADTEDHLRWVKFSEPSWTKDSAGFFYSRYPEPKADEKSAEAGPKTFGELADQKLYYHRLGAPQSEDRLIAQPAEAKWFVGGQATEDGRYLIIDFRRGDSDDTLLSFAELGEPQKPNVTAAQTKLVDQWEAQYDIIGDDGAK